MVVVLVLDGVVGVLLLSLPPPLLLCALITSRCPRSPGIVVCVLNQLQAVEQRMRRGQMKKSPEEDLPKMQAELGSFACE